VLDDLGHAEATPNTGQKITACGLAVVAEYRKTKAEVT
jgi:hypothetical protein